LNAFKEYEHVSSEICMFKFFNLLSKVNRIDEDMFSTCAVGVSGWVGGWGMFTPNTLGLLLCSGI
jgi:hypothetical protein